MGCGSSKVPPSEAPGAAPSEAPGAAAPESNDPANAEMKKILGMATWGNIRVQISRKVKLAKMRLAAPPRVDKPDFKDVQVVLGLIKEVLPSWSEVKAEDVAIAEVRGGFSGQAIVKVTVAEGAAASLDLECTELVLKEGPDTRSHYGTARACCPCHHTATKRRSPNQPECAFQRHEGFLYFYLLPFSPTGGSGVATMADVAADVWGTADTAFAVGTYAPCTGQKVQLMRLLKGPSVGSVYDMRWITDEGTEGRPGLGAAAQLGTKVGFLHAHSDEWFAPFEAKATDLVFGKGNESSPVGLTRCFLMDDPGSKVTPLGPAAPASSFRVSRPRL